MRSKEVDEAINNLKEDVKYADLRDTVDGDCTICYIEDLETVLSYIEQLEKLPNEIRDNIKDIEMQIKGEKANRYTIPECLITVKILKSIIGE